jgi:hypothetical protein
MIFIRIDFQNSKQPESFKPPEKVDVILHEQIGDELFEENMIENLLDLKTESSEGGRIYTAGQIRSVM